MQPGHNGDSEQPKMQTEQTCSSTFSWCFPAFPGVETLRSLNIQCWVKDPMSCCQPEWQNFSNPRPQTKERVLWRAGRLGPRPGLRSAANAGSPWSLQRTRHPGSFAPTVLILCLLHIRSLRDASHTTALKAVLSLGFETRLNHLFSEENALCE